MQQYTLWIWIGSFVAVWRCERSVFLLQLVHSLWARFAFIRVRPAAASGKHLIGVRAWKQIPIEMWSFQVGFGLKATFDVVVSNGISMSAEEILSSVEDFLCESTCENCDDTTCFAAVAGCCSCERAFLTRQLVVGSFIASFSDSTKVEWWFARLLHCCLMRKDFAGRRGIVSCKFPNRVG